MPKADTPDQARESELIPFEDNPGLRAAFLAMIEKVPETGDDAAARIVEQILTATEAGDLDAPWRSDGMRSLMGVPIQVQSIRRASSSFEDGFGWYLVVTGVRRDNGERIVTTTGSTAVCAQLVRAYSLDLFPLTVIPTPAKRPTREGFEPYHLTVPPITGRNGAPSGL